MRDGKNKKIPRGVKIISILYYFQAFLLILGLFFFGLLGIEDAGIILGIFFIFAVVFFFIGRGLWKGNYNAKIVAIILSVLGILIGLFDIIKGRIFPTVFYLILYSFIVSYFLFNKKSKRFFK